MIFIGYNKTQFCLSVFFKFDSLITVFFSLGQLIIKWSLCSNSNWKTHSTSTAPSNRCFAHTPAVNPRPVRWAPHLAVPIISQRSKSKGPVPKYLSGPQTSSTHLHPVSYFDLRLFLAPSTLWLPHRHHQCLSPEGQWRRHPPLFLVQKMKKLK